MANIVIYDPTTTFVTSYLTSVNTAVFEGRDDILINPTMPADLPLDNLRVMNGKVVSKTKTQLAALEKQKYAASYRDMRRAEYPDIGDQLDAILKHLNYMQMDGQTDLVTELDGIVGKWLSVKTKYPKPE